MEGRLSQPEIIKKIHLNLHNQINNIFNNIFSQFKLKLNPVTLPTVTLLQNCSLIELKSRKHQQ